MELVCPALGEFGQSLPGSLGPPDGLIIDVGDITDVLNL